MNTLGVTFSTLSILGKTLLVLAIANYLSGARRQHGRSVLLRGQRETMPAEDTLEGRREIKNQNFIITKKIVWFGFAAYSMLQKQNKNLKLGLEFPPHIYGILTFFFFFCMHHLL